MNTGRLPVLIVSTDGDSTITVPAPSNPTGILDGDTAILTAETLQSICDFHYLDIDSVKILKSSSRIPMDDPRTSKELNQILFDWIEEKI